MAIRSGIIVIIRMFAIFMAFQVVSFSLAIAATGKHETLQLMLAAVAVYALILLPCLAIAWGAPGIVDFLSPRSGETYPEGSVTTADLQAIGFSLVGAYILYGAMRETLSALFLLQTIAENSGLALPTELGSPIDLIVRAVLGWIVGFYFLLGAPALRRWIGNLRRKSPRVD
jgi:hypothetical protein